MDPLVETGWGRNLFQGDPLHLLTGDLRGRQDTQGRSLRGRARRGNRARGLEDYVIGGEVT